MKEKFFCALREAIRRAGSQTELAKMSGMQQSRISDYLSERYDFDNITVGTLRKIFPELEIQYFSVHPIQEKGMEQEIEKMVVEHFRHLSSSEKARYVMFVAANFPDGIRDFGLDIAKCDVD